MKPNLGKEVTVVVGDEYDERVWEALREALRALGASVVSQDWQMAGSQEIDSFSVELPSGCLCVESETYIGISVSGPGKVVEKVQALIAQRLSQ